MNQAQLRDRWKYTNLKRLQAIDWQARPVKAKTDQLMFVDSEDEAPIRLVFVNGYFDEQLSQQDALPDGVQWQVEQVKAQATVSMGLTELALQPGMQKSHARLLLDKHVLCQPLIYCIALTTEDANHCYVPIKLDVELNEGAQCRLQVETLSFKNTASFQHLETCVKLANHANLQHYLMQKECSDAYQWQQLHIEQHANSEYQSFHLHSGAELARVDVMHRFCGEHARGQHLGFYHSDNQQQHHIYIDAVHEQPHCSSDQHFKGIVDDRAHSVFSTKVTVQEAAHGTNAAQKNQNLLLSSAAEIDTKPDLEIYNDDVACSHGATVGNLNADALFYLRSRGIAEKEARSMLTRSFAAELVHQIKDAFVMQGVEQCLQDMLQGSEGV